jgi:subtilisin family serine protease
MIRLPRRFLPLLWSVLLAAPALASGITVLEGSPDGVRVAIDRSAETADVRVVVELQAPRAAVANRAADLEGDLQRIHARLSPVAAVQSSAAPRPRVRHVFSHVLHGASATVHRDAVAALRALPYVRRVYRDVPYQAMGAEPFDGVAAVRAPQVWESFAVRGSGIVVAVLDSGIDYNHEAFGGGFGEGHRVAGGYDFVDADLDPMDENGHGTHVAGILAGNGGGVTGVAPEVTLLAYRVLDERGKGWLSDTVAALDRALDPNQDGDTSDRVDVVNISLGGPGDANDPMAVAVDAATAAGVVVCVAAGNREGEATIGSPGAARTAITVGASHDDQWFAVFSSRGPIVQTADMKPDVMAPGVAIQSAKLGGGVEIMQGTSMAAPHVAGAAALLKLIHPHWTPADIKAALVSTGDAGTISRTYGGSMIGGGRIDAVAAANAEVLVAPPAQLSFGVAGTTAYSRTLPLRLVNRGQRRQSLTVSVVKTMFRQRGELTVTPSSFDLEPGQTIELSVQLSLEPVDAGIAEVPGGILRFTGTSEFGVPWGVIQGAAVTVRYAAEKEFSAWPLRDGRLMQWQPGVPAAKFEGDPVNQTAGMLLGAGTYDFLGVDGDGNLFVAEQRRVEGAALVAVEAADVKHAITPAGVDDLGRPLEPQDGFCGDHLTLFLPGSTPGALSYLDVVGKFAGVRASDISSRFTFAWSRGCVDRSRRTSHAIVFEPLVGVDKPVSLTNLPSDWRSKSVRIFLPTDRTESYANLSFRLRAENDWARRWGSLPWFAVERVPVDLGRGTAEEVVTLFVARGSWPLLNYEPTVEAIVRRPGEPFTASYFGSFLTVGEDGEAALAPMYGGDDRTFAPVEPELHLGDGPVRPLRTVVPRGYREGMFTLESKWLGTLNEHRYRASEVSPARLFGPDGNEIAPAVTDFVWTHFPRSSLQAGPHRVLIVNDRYETAGMRGRATATMTFDTRNADITDPEISTLRVMNGKGETRSKISAGDAVQVAFSLADYEVHIYEAGRYDPVRIDATRLSVRPHGSSAWIAAPVRVTGGAMQPVEGKLERRLPLGIEFRADLQLAAGAYDLRIEAEDRTGNRTELVFEPAFAVVQTERRRTVRH